MPSSSIDKIPTSIFPWWGSKRRLVRPLVSIIISEKLRQNKAKLRPSSAKAALVSPFAGTGIVEATLQNMGEAVCAYDADPRIVNMHRSLRTPSRRKEVSVAFGKEAKALRGRNPTKQIVRYKTVLRDAVLQSQNIKGAAQLAARWNLGMRCSFLGMLRRGSSFSTLRASTLNVNRIRRALEAHKGLGSACARKDVFSVLRNTPRERLLFLDPPYLLDKAECQYEAGNFGFAEHARLARELQGRDFILCHREDPAIRKLYNGCEILKLPRIMNINRASKSGDELVIVGRRSQLVLPR